jgi:phosphonate transport system substrate-binding protein
MAGLPFRNGRRRLLTAWAASYVAAGFWPGFSRGAAPQGKGKLLFGTTPVFLDNQIRLLGKWRAELEAKLGQEVAFIQRGNYGEITELLLADQLDAAWVCGYPYVTHADRLKLLVVPQYRGKQLYQSYLLVPASDVSTTNIAELGGRVFAYSDPQSNSGYLVPRTELIRRGIDPRRFFSKTFFTFAHRNIVDAVSTGLASAGEIDGYILDTLAKQDSDSVAKVRVAWRSPEYGFPPIVARRNLPIDVFTRLQVALLSMADDQPGRELLEHLNIDRFVIGSDALFDGIRGLIKLSDTMPV